MEPSWVWGFDWRTVGEISRLVLYFFYILCISWFVTRLLQVLVAWYTERFRWWK